MEALNLDYQAPLRKYSPLAITLLVTGCALAVAVLFKTNEVQKQIDIRTQTLDEFRTVNEDRTQHAVILGERKKSAEYYKAKQDILAKLRLPWVPLFKAIENAQDTKVFLLAIEPNVKAHTLRLTAETDSLPRALGYLNKLQRQPVLSEVTLTEHEVEIDTPGQPVKFVLNLAWVVPR